MAKATAVVARVAASRGYLVYSGSEHAGTGVAVLRPKSQVVVRDPDSGYGQRVSMALDLG